MTNWDSKMYTFANDCVVRSLQSWEKGEITDSWCHTIPARLAYLCSTIIDIVTLPFASLYFVFGITHALFTWDKNSTTFQASKTKLMDKTNRIFLSACGAFISPALSYKGRNVNLVPYLIAFRIIVLTGALVYYLKKP